LQRRHGGLFKGDYMEMTLDFEFTAEDGNSQLRVVYGGEALMTGIAIQPPSLDASALGAYAGDYRSDELDVTHRVELDGDTLYLRVRNSREPLRPTLEDEFATRAGGIQFGREANGAVDGFAASMSRSSGVSFRRV
jgi:hypothetical protein